MTDKAPRPTIAQLLAELGYGAPGTDIDEVLLWLIVEVKQRREGVS